MTDEEKVDAHEQALEQLRNYVSSLRKEQRQLDERREEIESRSDEVTTELVSAEAALKGLAMTRAPQLPKRPEPKPARVRRAPVRMETARDAMQQMGEFTIPELGTLLDVTVTTARRLVMKALEEPFGQDDKPIIADTGKTKRPDDGIGASARVFSFVRPETNGNVPHSRPRGAPEIELCRRGATPAPTGRKLKLRKDARELVALAEASGYKPERTRNGHIRLVNPETGDRTIIAGSDSDHRAAKNAKARLKRGKVAA